MYLYLLLSNSADLYMFKKKKPHGTFSWFFAILTSACTFLAFWQQFFTCKCASCTAACISDIFTSNNSPSPLSFLRFWLENMLRATAASNLSPSVLAEDLRTGCFAKPTFRASRSTKRHISHSLLTSLFPWHLWRTTCCNFPCVGCLTSNLLLIITIILAPAR